MLNNVVAIIQARMGSTRLPGKILMPLAQKPVLLHIVERLKHCQNLDKIVIATTTNTEDNVVESLCLKHEIAYFRGSEQDVLDRYYQAALLHNGQIIVRITADCPVIDPTIVDEVIEKGKLGQYDMYSLGGAFPDGLDCSIFRFEALAKAWKEAKLTSEREHVGPYLLKHPEKFKLGTYNKYSDSDHHRWTLDEPEDYQLLTGIFEHLYVDNHIFLAQDILNWLKSNPSYLRINQHIKRNEGLLTSLRNDKPVMT